MARVVLGLALGIALVLWQVRSLVLWLCAFRSDFSSQPRVSG
jgi:succinate-acetate transporter protein